MAKVCPKCGAENSDDIEYCGFCEANLSKSAEVTDMAKAGYCEVCKKDVWLEEDGSCQFGHPASSVSNVYEAQPEKNQKKNPLVPILIVVGVMLFGVVVGALEGEQPQLREKKEVKVKPKKVKPREVKPEVTTSQPTPAPIQPPLPKQEDQTKLAAMEFYDAMIDIINSAVPANKYLIAVIDNPVGVVGRQNIYNGLGNAREQYATLNAKLESTKPPAGFEGAWNSLKEYLRLCQYSAYYLADYVDTGVPKYRLWAVDFFNEAMDHKQQALGQLESRGKALGIPTHQQK